MGCIKKIIQIIILALALIGFISIGGKDFVMQQYEKYLGSTKESLMEKASKLGDFSELSDEFEIDRTASAFGYKGVLAEHNASGQKIIIVDSGKRPFLTQEDFKKGVAETKIKAFIKSIKYQSIQIDDFKVVKTGSMTAYDRQVPYMRFTAKINKLPVGQIGGVISAVDLSQKDTRVLISLNENKKYSQLITNEFFSKVK